MQLTGRQRLALIWLGQPANASNFVSHEMLCELAAQGMIRYEPGDGTVVFTEAGAELYRSLTGTLPTRYLAK